MSKLAKQLLSITLIFVMAVANIGLTRASIPKDDDTSIEDNGSW